MNTTGFPKVVATATLALAAMLLYFAYGSVSAQTKTKPKPKTPNSGQQGRALVLQFRCNSCHGADLAGKPGFSPSLHASGELKHYNQTTFERVLLTGITEDGKHVKPPMPIYGRSMPPRPGGPPPGGRRPPPGGPPPGGPPPGGPRGGGPGGGPPGGMGGPMMSKPQADAIYAYLRTLK